jgi:hypothetical protein
MKINVDAAISKSELGILCRGADGAFLGAFAVVVAGISDPTTLEAMACREALALATDLHP